MYEPRPGRRDAKADTTSNNAAQAIPGVGRENGSSAPLCDQQEKLRREYAALRRDWLPYADREPERAVKILEKGIALAARLNEAYWEMEARHWLTQLLLFKIRDYKRALPLAMSAAVEARKPKFAHWRTRVCLYQDLIAAYVGADAVSYAAQIEKALTNMQREAGSSSPCARCLLAERTTFEIRRGDMKAAEAAGREYLERAWTSHHRSVAHNSLAYVAFRRGDWQALLAEGLAVHQEAVQADNPDIAVYGHLWQAVAHQRLGNCVAAADAFARGEAQRAQLGVTPMREYWEARVAYALGADDLQGAVDARRAHLAAIRGRGAEREEAEAWIDLCRLQKTATGRVDEEAAQQARTAIMTLPAAGDLQGQLTELLRDR